jgi:hypothetical protein
MKNAKFNQKVSLEGLLEMLSVKRKEREKKKEERK